MLQVFSSVVCAILTQMDGITVGGSLSSPACLILQVVHMDVRGNTVKLSDGSQISYDKCLIATGKGFLCVFCSHLLLTLCCVRLFISVTFTWQGSSCHAYQTLRRAVT